MKQRAPTVVLKLWDVPRLIVRVLADDRAGPDLDPGLLAPILEILRGAAEDRPVPDAHVLGQAHVALEPGARPIRQRSPMLTWSPTITHGPISTPSPSCAVGSMIAVG